MGKIVFWTAFATCVTVGSYVGYRVHQGETLGDVWSSVTSQTEAQKLMKQGDAAYAEKDYRQAVDYYNLALDTHLKAGKGKQLSGFYYELLLANTAECYFRLWRKSRDEVDRSQAVMAYQRFLSQYPTHSDAPQARRHLDILRLQRY